VQAGIEASDIVSAGETSNTFRTDLCTVRYWRTRGNIPTPSALQAIQGSMH